MLSPLLLGLLSGCLHEPGPADCGDPDDRIVLVVTTMGYLRPIDDTISEGYDVDGTDDDVCGKDDYVSPAGVEGIDNGLAQLIPVLDGSEAKVVEGYINEAIIEGRLMMILEISRVDDLENDDCVDVEFLRGVGDPLLGTHGGILEGQTLERDTSKPSARVEGVSIVDGRLDARPFDVELPVSILDADFTLEMLNGGVTVEFGDEGVHTGFFSGGIPLEGLVSILYSSPGVGTSIQELVEPVMELAADLAPDENGECTQLSAGFQFEALEVFLFD